MTRCFQLFGMSQMTLHRAVVAMLFTLLLPGFSVAEQAPSNTYSPGAEEVPRVEFYSSAGCGYCRALRTYLQARGISYREHNINEALATREAFYAMGGQGTPLVVIGSRRIHGFDPFAIEAALAAELDP